MKKFQIAEQCTNVAQEMKHLTPFRIKHFSFLMSKGQVISVGWNNMFKTHPLAKQYGHRFHSIHSELHCITKCQQEIDEIKKPYMVNIRINKYNKLRNSRPCVNCIELLCDYGVFEVVYYCVEANSWIWENIKTHEKRLIN